MGKRSAFCRCMHADTGGIAYSCSPVSWFSRSFTHRSTYFDNGVIKAWEVNLCTEMLR